jgi:pimeloyl-ACP methyl ester carboxylesterase
MAAPQELSVDALRKLLFIVPGHHQQGTWPPYQALARAFEEGGWTVAHYPSPREPASKGDRQWHHPNVSEEGICAARNAWYVSSIGREYEAAYTALKEKKKIGYDEYAVLGHSLHAHLAYQIVRELLQSERASVLALTPHLDLKSLRERKQKEIGMDGSDSRFSEGGAIVHYDKYTRCHDIMVYTNTHYWDDYLQREERDAAREAIRAWRGKSIIIHGQRDRSLGLDELLAVVNAHPRNPTLLEYPGGHRPTPIEAAAIGSKLVRMLSYQQANS